MLSDSLYSEEEHAVFECVCVCVRARIYQDHLDNLKAQSNYITFSLIHRE